MRNLIALMFLFLSSSVLAAEAFLDEGDLIRVSVYGNPDLTTEAEVSASGKFNFPLIGEVSVGGISKPEVEELISKRLIDEGFLKHAQVNVIVLKSLSQQVSVLGHVHRPGKYNIEPGSEKLLDFLALSGGVAESGDYMVTILRMRGSQTKRVSVNVNQLLMEADVSLVEEQNIEMKAGDVIYVPRAPVFYLYGEAARPGVYRYRDGMRVEQAISVGGGISNRGSDKDVDLHREGKVVQDVGLAEPIQKNDVIRINESLF